MKIFKSPIFIYLLPFALIPLVDRNSYHLDVLTGVGLYALLAVGLNVVVGLTGLLNLGYAAFFAIGAYTYALANIHWHWNFWLGLPLAGGVSMLFGLLIGLPSIRVRGDYLAITTLGFGEIVRISFNNLDTVTGGPNGLLGIDRPNFFGFVFSVSPIPYFYLILAMFAVVVFLLFRLCDSKIGRALVAIREDELAASCMGVPVLQVKLLAFGISSFIAGMAGAFFASKQTIITPDSFDFVFSVLILAMVVLGGLGNIWGAALGALVLGVLPELLRSFAAYRMLIFGLVMILMMIFRPQGILGNQIVMRELKTKKREVEDVSA